MRVSSGHLLFQSKVNERVISGRLLVQSKYKLMVSSDYL